MSDDEPMEMSDYSQDNDSDYSLDYEYPGPRFPNRRTNEDDDASELSDSDSSSIEAPRFDMWDDDPFNDYTWHSNDMQLTKFIKRKQKQLKAQSINNNKLSFWTKKKGWPKQLPFSCSSTNHDQSANAICLVESDYGLSEQIYAVYRDRIVECGHPGNVTRKKADRSSKITSTTWIESNDHQPSTTTKTQSDKFVDTHLSVSLPKTIIPSDLCHSGASTNFISQFQPYTKFIKRRDFPGILPESAYLSLGFDPQCLAHKYGYMAIGGVEGEFELYCCMDPQNPVKIWGTKFKGTDNVMLMTNAIQIVRWQNSKNQYKHMLIGCMNKAGLLLYNLPPHSQCKDIRHQSKEDRKDAVPLFSHVRSFEGVPINDAKLSPLGTKIVCVGDEGVIFMIDVYHCTETDQIGFSTPHRIVIPPCLLGEAQTQPYFSQYVAWSASSQYFAHTSDSHNVVFVWRASTREIIYSIDTAGYTYAISFHPYLDNIIVFTNRYGYFHTVDLSDATDANNHRYSILDYDRQNLYYGHECLETCIVSPGDEKQHAVFHTRHLKIRHEITMVSFRGEVDKKLRILAKINGIQWTREGTYLYLATKKRVLAFQFIMSAEKTATLLDITDGSHCQNISIQE
ncbi:hypothetical protein K501DRAFT_229700 [Backusella circina FSU 941]|nr:hypothetical protein K501DRAFT_229700 [Backusella circina FSU 941]